MTPLHQFGVRIGRRKVNIAVWPDLREFRQATDEPDTDALGYFIYDDSTTGTIHLRRGFLTTEIVAHESTHAVSRLCRIARRDNRSGAGEEWAAECIGQLTAKICGELANRCLLEAHE